VNYFTAGSVTLNGSALSVAQAQDTSVMTQMSAIFYLISPASGNNT